MTKDKKVQWHPGFYGAMHLEFRENKEDLEFTEESVLNTMPLRVDMLIVKKKHPCEIQNEIGKLFRTHNLLEYKSPDDNLNYNVFLKGLAYAYLYKSSETCIDEILLEDVTLSYIRERKPIKLFKKLQKENFHIEEKWPGIYYIIKEGFIKIQIIVSKKLSCENHIWLNSLSENINVQQAIQLIEITERLEELDEKNYAESLWEVVETVNKETIQKVREDDRMPCRVVEEIVQYRVEKALKKAVEQAVEQATETATETGFNNGFNDKGISIFKNLIKDGMSRELAQKYTEISDVLVEKALAEM